MAEARPYSAHYIADMNFCYFGKYHCYKDLDLVLESTVINYPERRTVTSENLYTQGLIDSTDAVSDTKFYKNRKIEMTFKIVDNPESPGAKEKKLAQVINGVYFDQIFISEFNAMFSGRVSINKFKSQLSSWNKTIAREVVIDIDAKPWRIPSSIADAVTATAEITLDSDGAGTLNPVLSSVNVGDLLFVTCTAYSKTPTPQIVTSLYLDEVKTFKMYYEQEYCFGVVTKSTTDSFTLKSGGAEGTYSFKLRYQRFMGSTKVVGY